MMSTSTNQNTVCPECGKKMTKQRKDIFNIMAYGDIIHSSDPLECDVYYLCTCGYKTKSQRIHLVGLKIEKEKKLNGEG